MDSVGTIFTFTDRHNNLWDVELDLDGALRIDSVDYSGLLPEEHEGFSILSPDKKTFTLLLTDVNLLFTVIFALVRPQVKNNLGVDPDEHLEEAIKQFKKGIDGSTIERAREAFWGSLMDFFPEQKTALLTYMKARKQAVEAINRKLTSSGETLANLITQTVEAEFNQLQTELKEKLGESFTGH